MSQHRFPYAPSHQQHTGPVYDWVPERMRGVRGQETPRVEQRQAARYGSYLSGVNMPRTTLGDPINDIDGTDELNALEQIDDVYGSGIFDGQDRGPTANTDTGVFASNYGLPGYLAREVPFQVSQELVSLPSGAESIYVPGGGMAYVERQGELVGPDQVGPIPELPPTTMHPEQGGNLQTYVSVEEQDAGWEYGGPAEQNGVGNISQPVPRKPAYPSGYVPAERQLGPSTQIVHETHDGRAMIGQQRRPVPRYPTRQLFQQPQQNRLRLRDPMLNYRMVPRQAVRGLGQTEGEGMSVWGYLAVGGLVGVAATILWGTLNRTPRRAR